MTALNEYQRIEAAGLWRASEEAQRIDVIASIGDATLVITDMQDRALTHWSLPAVMRANPGERPAIYHPDGDPAETLELGEDEADMIDAIEKLRTTIEKRRPHPGRLRLIIMLGLLTLVLGAAVFWLPGTLRQHAATVVPDVKRAEIGASLFTHVTRMTGPPCRDPQGEAALAALSARVPGPEGETGQLMVIRDGMNGTIHLPGGTILINRALIEDYDEPDVVAGYVLAERLRTAESDPLVELLSASPLWSSFKLLTTGDIPEATLEAYAETLITTPSKPMADEALLQGFETASLRSTPYAYAVDISGETTLPLIEADPFAAASPEPVMNDADWLRLQSICGG